MSTQSEFNANFKANAQKNKTADNARSAAKKKEDKVIQTKNLNDSIVGINRTIIGPATKEVLAAEPLLNQYQSAYNAYTRAHKNEPGYPSAGDTAALNTLSSLIGQQQAVIVKNKKIINDADANIKKFTKQIQDSNPLFFPTSLQKPKKNLKNLKAGEGQKLAFSKDYKYNAPMVKSAYFGMDSIQSNSVDGNYVDQGNYQDAMQAWKGTQGGRGTIQMDRKFMQLFDLSDPNSKFDLQKYGFKFLYNPTNVSMAWGLMSSMDPTFEATGLDKFQAVSAGLLSSTIEFEIMLNRIADFDYINENGLRSSGKDPYPLTVSNDDLKQVYRKGTMYDIEYLLKTINGPNGDFNSALNGLTADRAWMRPSIVELHLGAGMRYRVRIANLSVNHIFFNNRMVPTLSTIKLTCARFNDGPQATTTVTPGGGSLSPASSLADLRNSVPGYGR
jgi:hypothetical protein